MSFKIVRLGESLLENETDGLSPTLFGCTVAIGVFEIFGIISSPM